MPPFVFADFLATMPTIPTLLAWIAVSACYVVRVLSRREREREERLADRLREAARERARMDALLRISANHRSGKGAA